MSLQSFDNITFKPADLQKTPFHKGEYENCTFENCDLSNTDFADSKFIDCGFLHCNLSLVRFNKTSFRDVKFKGCKMLGLMFDRCNEFGLSFSFEDCVLTHSSFYKMKIIKTVFKNTDLKEVDFTECNLSGSVFSNCELLNAKFENTVLEKADLRSSRNYSIHPERNKVKKAKFGQSGLAGLLEQYGIEIDFNH